MTRDPQTTFDSVELYEACGSEDAAEQEHAFRTLWDYLYRIAYHIVYQRPDADALAKDAAQSALIRIFEQRTRCREPRAFRVWSRRIVSNIAIDELRRRKRLLQLDEQEEARSDDMSPAAANLRNEPLERLTAQDLRRLLLAAPISERSRRVVIGRFLDDMSDEFLAQHESGLAAREVRPSHIQVTRSKNIEKLREWGALRSFLREVA